MILILFPMLAFLGLWGLFNQKLSMRESFIWASIIFGLFVVIITEVLSLFKWIKPVPLALSWLFLSFLVIVILIKYYRTNLRINIVFPRSFSSLEKVLLSCIITIMAITFIIALVAPPNNYDSMTYHMSRVVHWEQNQSIAHYPTGIVPQLSLPPLAEFIILNFQILSGNDRFANLVQWISMFGSVIVITLIAQLLGGNRKQQILSGFIGSTIPMGILQATSTQNDYVVAFWLLGLVYFVIKSDTGWGAFNIAGAAMALGLAILTKSIAFFYAFPFLVWLIYIYLKKVKLNSWKYLLFMLLIILAINSGHYYRNFNVFSSIEGPNYSTKNETILPRNILSNCISYFAANLATPSFKINNAIEDGVAHFNGIIGVKYFDKRSVREPFEVYRYAPHEDIVPSPVHLLLIVLSGIAFFCSRSLRQNTSLLFYCVSLFVGCLLLFALLRYQSAFFRFTLSFIVLSSPLLGIILEKIFSKGILVVMIIVMMILALPPLIMNITRPIIPPPLAHRSEFSILNVPRQFFYFGGGRQAEYESYKNIVKTIKNRKYINIGVIGINNEYPLWALLENSGIKFRLEHLEVDNLSNSIKMDFKPSAVIIFSDDPLVEEKYRYKFKYREIVGKSHFGRNIIIYGE